MSNKDTTTKYVGGGTGFLGLLTLLFIHHKLLGTITWSWLWVLSPLWITLAVLFFIVLCVLFAAYIIKK